MAQSQIAPFRFSHNDTNESAKSCIRRMDASHEITRRAFIEMAGKEEITQLEQSLGHRTHAFHLSTDANGNVIAYADIQAIHYIFAPQSESKTTH